jgi:uncharacterized protein (DUF1501 family)
MLSVTTGAARGYCHGLTRRNFVSVGVAGMAAAGLPQVLEARAAGRAAGLPAKDTAVILLWLDGGPGHLDLYDLKPEAPAEYRGLWRPIRTNVPGIEISELFPRQAAVADRFSLIRSLHHDNGDHFTAAHYLLTGRGGPNGSNTAGRNPAVGAIAARQCGPRQPGMPAYVAVPYASSVGLRPGYFGGSYLGPQWNPFETDGDPAAVNFQVRNLVAPAGLSLGRLADRVGLRRSLDELRRQSDASGATAALDRFQAQAYDLVTSPAARRAFDLSLEPDAVRDRYGRTGFGQSALLARRLVEAGSTFVTVHSGGWDHHWDLEAGMKSRLPEVDAAVAALLSDLAERGQLQRVMVVLCGEFSRTPKMNDGGNGGPPLSKGTPGRDHWGHAMFALVAGGGIQGGRVVGSTDARGERPRDRPVTPFDLHATIYHVLGADPQAHFLDHTGRPVPAVDAGSVISELF